MSIFLIVLLALASSPVAAQYGGGTLLGTVTDPSGAVVPGAKVVAKNTATNETREFTTDAAGNYQFNAMPSGAYIITVTCASFKSVTVPDLVLRVNSQLRADVTMQLGAVAETVEVAATTPQLQTNTAAIGTVVDNRTVLELPFNARNFFDLIALTPGVVKTRGASSVMDERSAEIGGIRNTSTNAMLDGVDFSVANINNPAIALSLDTIAEFKVQMNFMDASYGHGAAGIDLVTRRGGNEFHGVAYDFIRNRAFQAGQFFRPPQGAPRFSYNQFGASAGGPIIKNRTFVYGNYEGRRRRTGIILQGLIPNEEMKRGDFTTSGKTVRDPANNNTPFPGNAVPRNRWDRISNELLQYFPSPNASRPGVNYLTTPSDRERRDQFTIRLDHRFTSKGNWFGRYSFADDELVNVAYLVGKGLIRPDRTQHLSLGYTHLASSNLISETRAGFTKAFLARQSDGDRFSKNYAAELGLKNLAPNPGDYTLPSANLTGYAPGTPTGTSGFVGYGLRIVQNNIYYRLGETVTWIKSRHNLKIGGDVSRLMVGYDQGSNQNGNFNFSGNFSGDAFGDYLLGNPQSANGGLGGLGNFGGVAKYSIGTQFQWFLQDDWKITDRLTLNLGLRHEFFLQWRGRLANFDLATGRQILSVSPDYYIPGVGLIAGQGAPLLAGRPIVNDPNDFGPRLGVAYRLGNKTVIRAGAGVFHAINTGGATLVSMTSTLPYFVNATVVSGNARPELVFSQLFPAPSQVPGAVTSHQDLSRRTGYLYQYNLNVQHQLKPNLLLEAGYIGNTGHKQVGTVLVNQPRLPASATDTSSFASRSPYPLLTPGFSQNTNYQWSNYNAGFVKLEKRAARGLSLTGAYTWSKFLDSGAAGQNMYNRRPERGLADNDVRHNFISSWVYELPFGKGQPWNISNSLLNAVAGGWQVNGIVNFRSGMPYSISTASDIANVGTGGQRANAAGSPPRKLDPRTSGLLGLDRAAYATPARATFGNLSRNTQPGFGINNWDFSAIKNFGLPWLGESAKLQFRFEWFNFFNHTQFLNPAATQNVPATFGIVTGALDPRILQIAGKIYW
ncbi:MAG: carboxypeptidase regulatory-like domain-containing protein [Acidobacteria bacterium]|nr:carboxypeptidase regulatory-like domain-containing protein [Acidobacteriota bacterium]